MCWSATTSFTTLVIGTLLNLGSYRLLAQWESPTALLVWSWQYALLMQIPEGIVWLQLDQDEDISAMSRLAMVLNVTQPVALLLGIRFGKLYRGEFRYAYVALFMYALLMITEFDQVWTHSKSIAPENECRHLDLRYWNTPRAFLYVAASLFIISEARPVVWAYANASIFAVSLLLALVIYPCGVGSVWCWFIFVSGPLLVLFDVAQRRVTQVVSVAETVVPVVPRHPNAFVTHRPRV